MYRQKPEDVIGVARPFTGAQYLESLRDGREVYVYGERVKDVTTHPAFRNTVRIRRDRMRSNRRLSDGSFQRGLTAFIEVL